MITQKNVAASSSEAKLLVARACFSMVWERMEKSAAPWAVVLVVSGDKQFHFHWFGTK